MASISGSVTIAGDPDDWIACAFDADTHAFAGVAVVSAGSYTISGLTAGKAYVVACRPKSGPAWSAGRVTIIGDYTTTSNPNDFPYIFKATNAADGTVSARYWRVNGFSNIYGGLEISEIQLHSDSGNENGAAAITSPPAWSFALSSVIDGNLGTYAYWNTLSGLYFKWDFESDKIITGLKFGSNTNSAKYPESCIVQYSNDDTNWTTIKTASNISWPGNNSYGEIITLAEMAKTGAIEPDWPQTVNDTVDDNLVTWTNMGQLVQPLMQGPLIAA